ncbi:MAG: hypothetical protein MHM6MM_004697 [Cercozoa sp. M6MM]
MQEAEDALCTVFDEREFRVMQSIRESLTVQSFQLGQTSLYDVFPQSEQLLLRLMRNAAVIDLPEFVNDLMRIEAPGRRHIDGLHKYAEHEELEGTDKVSEWANAILRKPLQKFESSQWEAHRNESVAHVNARALGYVRHLQKKQEKLNNSRYCVLTVTHGSFARALVATQVALSLHDTANLPPSSGEFQFHGSLGVKDADAMERHMEFASSLESDNDPAFANVVSMDQCDMFVLSEPVSDVVPASERPVMVKLPAWAPSMEEHVLSDVEPTHYDRLRMPVASASAPHTSELVTSGSTCGLTDSGESDGRGVPINELQRSGSSCGLSDLPTSESPTNISFNSGHFVEQEDTFKVEAVPTVEGHEQETPASFEEFAGNSSTEWGRWAVVPIDLNSVFLDGTSLGSWFDQAMDIVAATRQPPYLEVLASRELGLALVRGDFGGTGLVALEQPVRPRSRLMWKSFSSAIYRKLLQLHNKNSSLELPEVSVYVRYAQNNKLLQFFPTTTEGRALMAAPIIKFMTDIVQPSKLYRQAVCEQVKK